MSKITSICHLADIHIRKSLSRHPECREVFDNLYKSLKEKKPDRIVLVGDLFHDFIDLQPEAFILAGEFLKNLAKIAPVRITRGNHDIRKKAIKRKDSIEAIVSNIGDPNIIYYNETGFFDDENVSWAVWKHGERKNNPWTKRKKPKDGNITIDLFHDPVNSALSATGFEMNKPTYKSIEHFKGDYSFFGDIHKLQFFENDTKAYCGSLMAQNFAEGDYDFHGYILWDIEKGTHEEIKINNTYSFKTISVNAFTDFEDLELDIDEPTENMRVRVMWNTLPSKYNDVNRRAVIKYLKNEYNPISIKHQSEFIEDDEIEVSEDINVETITDPQVQHEIFTNYLEKIGIDDETTEEILKLDNEISSRVDVEEFTNIQWSVIKFSAKNFMSYENIEIDWRDLNGLFQITGINTAGKTTIMKLITYILYNKTRETEKSMKFGDQRYVNNRLKSDDCEGSIVIEVNGEYFGIKRNTTIERKKDGEIKGSPTKVEYYKLDSPDDEMSDENSIENLVEDERDNTQKSIDKAIGSYDNFMRVVMTTSDTLNEILSNDPAEFKDALLYDSGLDLFDKKLSTFKEYMKEFNSVPKVSCNVEKTEEEIKELISLNKNIDSEIDEIENEKIPEVNKSINKGSEYVESLVKKLNKIDDEIYNLNVDNTKEQIGIYKSKIEDLNEKYDKLGSSISSLKDSYDEDKLNKLTEKKDSHREEVSSMRIQIKEKEREIDNVEYQMGVVRGDIFRMKENGKKIKDEIKSLKNEKTCPTCGQLLDENHQIHINDKIKSKEEEMFIIGDNIKEKNQELEPFEEQKIELKNNIEEINNTINTKSLEMDKVMEDIGVLTSDKNEVERRKELQRQQDVIPVEIENNKLQMENLNQKITLHTNALNQIEENKKINTQIVKAKERLRSLEGDKEALKDLVYSKNTLKGQNITAIKENKELIVKFEKQERFDTIHNTYKKCIHRDGIPTQLLKTYAIPKINKAISELLSGVEFSIWLDEDDLKLKLAYNARLDAAIDALSASGKERTFASVVLKYALNQINMKSKPTLFLLDEVMGKLTDDSVEEFIEVLHAITDKMNKVLIVEHNHETQPDHLINVTKDDRDVSSLEIE